MIRLPTLRPREIIAALKKAGYVEHHQKGSHLFLWHPVLLIMTTVPLHPGDLPRGTVKAILQQTGISEEKLRELL